MYSCSQPAWWPTSSNRGAPRTVRIGAKPDATLRVVDRCAEDHPGTGGGQGRYFLFGLAYGAASLSCTLPIFLAVVGSSLTSSGVLGSARDLVLFGLGMATVVAGLTLGMVVFQATALRRVRGLGRIVEAIGTLIMLAAGSYVIFYWLTLGGLLGSGSA